ncbi:acyl-coenzyme A thioesterase 13-like isoform X1 [Schistocerca gregaria]|uniref:acyl-coenzyme A thioesterase 13-like isoform X1 n=1 Tax=Schistocerca gregaria TaxID=7010 RepID=UPI00211DCBAE|nr:acyl-coenzyme A thioesterase 13-like isoform X1 [Schistocerca gregaria]XP_049828664.1 acyl-coenzyme A thioesterase 13-like isoform X1 [Schistocerca gregaria]
MAGQGANFIAAIAKRCVEANGFERLLNKIRIISAGEGKCLAEFTVAQEHQNAGGTLHGGFTATLVDQISTYALMTYGKGVPGVSVNINVSYMKPASAGEEVIIDAQTLRAGKTLAFLEVDLKKKATGELIAKGSHTKFIGF